MSKLIMLALASIFSGCLIYAQTNPIPAKIDFQAIARDGNGGIIADQNIAVRMSVLQTPLPGMAVFQEEHMVQTDQYGHFALPIGTGTAEIGSFQEIDWTAGPYFVSIAIDPEGGSNYIEMGALEMMTVPYAFYAKHAEHVNDADADPQNEIQQLSLQGEVLSLSSGNSIQLPDASTSNELQQLNFQDGNLLSISGGNTIQLPAARSPWEEKGQSVYLESGKVGIGLSSVPHTLTLFGENQAYMNFLTSATEISQESGLIIGLHKLSNSALVWNNEPGDLRFGTNDKLSMYINQFGRVGVGTTAPGEKLEVTSTADDVGIRINAADKKTARLSLLETVGQQKFGFSWEYKGNLNALTLRSNGFRNDADEELLTITSGGVDKMGVHGVLNLQAIEDESTLLEFTNDNNPGSKLTAGLHEAEPVIDFTGSPMTIRAGGETALSIHTNGNVGIGKDDPNLDLDVNGSAEISKNLGVKEDLFVLKNAEMEGTLTIGQGSTMDQIEEFYGTTTEFGNNRDFLYPEGYNRSNTRILCLQIQFSSGNWGNIGAGDLEILHAVLVENAIRIFYPPKNAYQERPFRILLLRMSAKS